MVKPNSVMDWVLLFIGFYYSTSALANNVYQITYYQTSAKNIVAGEAIRACDNTIVMIAGVATGWSDMYVVAYCHPPIIL